MPKIPQEGGGGGGSVDFADTTETSAGTISDKALSPSGFAGSVWAHRDVQLIAIELGTSVTIGDGKIYFRIPESLDGMVLTSCHAQVITAGTTNATTIQLHNVTNAADILSTEISIDSGDTDSSTSDTPAVINTDEDDVSTGDIIRVDVDSVSTTPPVGLIVSLQYTRS